MWNRHLLLIVFLWMPTLDGQTRLADDQVRAVPVYTTEQAWCPGPVFQLTNSKTVRLGQNWSTGKPCFVHFNLAPPAKVDPIAMSSFTAGAEIVSNGNQDDELYIYMRAPAWAGSTMIRDKAIVVLARNPGAFTCTGCTLEAASAGIRIMPAFAVPVGVVQVFGGNIHPAVSDIISKHQIYIGMPEGVVFRADGAGTWLELLPEAQTIVAQRQSLQQAQTAAMLAVLEPPPSKRQLASASQQAIEQLGRLDYIEQTLQTRIAAREEGFSQDLMYLRQEVIALRALFDELKTALEAQTPQLKGKP